MIGYSNSEWGNHRLLMCDTSLNMKACWLCKHTSFSNVNQPILFPFFDSAVASRCAYAWMPFIFGAHSAFFSLDNNFCHFSWSGNLIEGRDLAQMEQLPLHAVLVGIPDSSLSIYTFCTVHYIPFLHPILGWEPSFLWFLRKFIVAFRCATLKTLPMFFSKLLFLVEFAFPLFAWPFPFFCVVKMCI